MQEPQATSGTARAKFPQRHPRLRWRVLLQNGPSDFEEETKRSWPLFRLPKCLNASIVRQLFAADVVEVLNVSHLVVCILGIGSSARASHSLIKICRLFLKEWSVVVYEHDSIVGSSAAHHLPRSKKEGRQRPSRRQCFPSPIRSCWSDVFAMNRSRFMGWDDATFSASEIS